MGPSEWEKCDYLGKKFALDVWYVNNQSFSLDMKILFLTVIKVLKSEGINQVGHVTMEPFTGAKSAVSGERK